MLRKLVLASVVLVVWPNSRIQLSFGLLVSVSTLLVTIQLRPYVASSCQRAQILAQLQVMFTYVAAQIFFYDPRTILDDEDASYQVADIILVCFNCLIFLFLAVMLVRGVQTAVTSRVLLDEYGMEMQAPALKPGHDFHIFLSHAWATGQDQMRILKEQLKERIPDLAIFLDVDDLREGKGGEVVLSSENILIFVSGGYFESVNCMRELLTAIFAGKKIVTLLESEETHGRMPKETILAQLRAADQKYLGRWGSATIGDEVRQWMANEKGREAGECFGAEREQVRDARQLHPEVLHALWRNCNCLSCQQWRRQQRGHAICSALMGGKPIAEELFTTLFEDEPLEWYRLPAFQLLTTHLLAQAVVETPLRIPANEMSLRRLAQPQRPARYHILCSPNNPGALALLIELAVLHGLKYKVKSSSSDAVKTAEKMVELRASGTAQPEIGHATLLITQDMGDLQHCQHMLLYLTSETWLTGQPSALLAADVAGALQTNVSAAKLLLVHEMLGIKSDERRGCEFGDFFACARGTTPSELISQGIYQKIAIGLRGGEWRTASMAMVHEAIAGNLDIPVAHATPFWFVNSPLSPRRKRGSFTASSFGSFSTSVTEVQINTVEDPMADSAESAAGDAEVSSSEHSAVRRDVAGGETSTAEGDLQQAAASDMSELSAAIVQEEIVELANGRAYSALERARVAATAKERGMCV